MNSNLFITLFLINFSLAKLYTEKEKLNITAVSYDELGDHTIVTDSDVFPYVVAIMEKTTYLSAGALVDENWVLTAADSLFLLRESVRVLRVRLGSINNRKGGVLLPIKYFEIHPYFRDTIPAFDIALVRLSQPVRFTPSLSPIKMQERAREVTATHFIVTAWPASMESDENYSKDKLKSMEIIKRHRMLMVSHLHPTDPELCTSELEALEVNATDTIMCLDQTPGGESCARDVGAPVVLNSVLWGIISSWKSEDCDIEPSPSFVTMVASRDISLWIHATVKGNAWSQNGTNKDMSTFFDEDYDENTIIVD